MDHLAGRPTIRAVVFDLDGTMFDTEALYFRVASEVVAASGGAFTPAVMRAMIGRQGEDSLRAFRTMTGLDGPIEPVLAAIRERFNAEFDTAVQPAPGLRSLLDRLDTLGLPRAVATSSRRAYAERLLRNHHLLDRFRFFLGSEDVTRHKPDPEVYLLAASRLGVEPTAMLVLEDTPTGLAAALAAGAYTVGLPHDQSPAEDLRSAHLVANSMADPALLRLLPDPGPEV